MALTQVQPGMLASDSQFIGFKNRIINGAMVIDQRNAGAAITLATNVAGFPVDRLTMYKGTAGATVTGQQASASIAGFEKCAVWTTTVASAPAAADINGIWQVIEGLNTLDMQWGTANAKACTVSFWFKATTAGTYAFAVNSGTVDVSYVATFNATSTFTYFSFVIPGPTTGTFSKTNTQAMYVTIDAGSGTNYNTATTGSWIAGNFKRTSACVNSTANTNTLSLTGFQFEVGSTATSFDYRPYGTELALCYRYYWRAVSGASFTSWGITNIYNATLAQCFRPLPVTMRASPTTFEFASAGNYKIDIGPTAYTVTVIGNNANYVSPNGMVVDLTTAGTMVAGQAGQLANLNNTTGFIGVGAEL